MLVALTQIFTKSGTDLHIIVLVCAMFVLSVFNTVAGVSNLSVRAAAFFSTDFHRFGRITTLCLSVTRLCYLCFLYSAMWLLNYRITLLSLRGAKFLLISGANGDGMVRAFCGQPFTQAQHLMQRSASVLHSLPRAMA